MRKKSPAKAEDTWYRCQHCGKVTRVLDWLEDGDVCPKCGKRHQPEENGEDSSGEGY
jgi:DNA-directed RNA polymerase subunit RPC12/RpoP